MDRTQFLSERLETQALSEKFGSCQYCGFFPFDKYSLAGSCKIITSSIKIFSLLLLCAEFYPVWYLDFNVLYVMCV